MVKVIFVRSPFIIEIKEETQTSTRIELDIYSSVGVLQNTYSFTKPIPSTVDYGTYYNISNFLLEYLTNIKPDYATTLESDSLYCSAIVRRYRALRDIYYKVDSTLVKVDNTLVNINSLDPSKTGNLAVESLIDSNTYLAVEGFTEYSNGMNSYLNIDAIPLTSDLILNTSNTYTYNTISQNINSSISNLGLYVNVLLQKLNTNTYTVKYSDGINTDILDITPANTNPTITKIFLKSSDITIKYPRTISLFRNTDLLWKRIVSKDEECKYTPSLCSFISKSGGWENVYFMKAKETSSTMENSTYSLLRDYNYNIYEGSKKSFNTNGNDFIKLNTGYVDESMNIILKDLLFSETILLDDKPVLIKNKAITYKNTLKEKLINYEIEFEYAFDYLNNVV